MTHARAYETWSPEDDEQLGQLFRLGYTVDEMAGMLHRPPAAVQSRIRLLGLDEEAADTADDSLL